MSHEYTHCPNCGENLVTCPSCGKPVKEKVGKYGVFVGCTGYPDCSYTRPTYHDCGDIVDLWDGGVNE